jgi:hypothetical protein
MVFVHSGTRFTQDNALARDIRESPVRKLVSFLDQESPGRLSERRKGSIYFGRFFLCSNMGEFSKANPGVPFVGVSIENVLRGAVMSIGYNTEEIGRMGARDILYPHATGKAFEERSFCLQPAEEVIAFNAGRLQECRLEVDSSFAASVRGTVSWR